MSQYFHIHPENPQKRLIMQAATIIREGGVIAYPTDSAYALGCCIDNKAVVERIRAIRQLDEKHNFTLVCRNLSEVSTYAHLDNNAYKLLKAHTPGPYTFILPATKEVPKRILPHKRKTIGVRLPDHLIVQTLLEQLAAPLMSVTLIMPGQDVPLIEPEAMRELLGKKVDLIIDGGYCGIETTTVIDLEDSQHPQLIRVGKGDASLFVTEDSQRRDS